MVNVHHSSGLMMVSRMFPTRLFHVFPAIDSALSPINFLAAQFFNVSRRCAIRFTSRNYLALSTALNSDSIEFRSDKPFVSFGRESRQRCLDTWLHAEIYCALRDEKMVVKVMSLGN